MFLWEKHVYVRHWYEIFKAEIFIISLSTISPSLRMRLFLLCVPSMKLSSFPPLEYARNDFQNRIGICFKDEQERHGKIAFQGVFSRVKNFVEKEITCRKVEEEAWAEKFVEPGKPENVTWWKLMFNSGFWLFLLPLLTLRLPSLAIIAPKDSWLIAF